MFKPSLPGNEGIKIRAKRTNQSPPAHAGGIYKPSRRRKKWIQLTFKFPECQNLEDTAHGRIELQGAAIAIPQGSPAPNARSINDRPVQAVQRPLDVPTESKKH